MNRRELAKAVAAHTELDPKVVAQVIQGTTDVITAAVAKGEPVTITGFAKFSKRKSAARMGRNPQTGEQIRIKASTKAKITPLKGYKDAVLNPKEAPKLERGILGADGTLGPKANETGTRRSTTATKSSAPAKKAPAKRAPAKKAAAAKKASAKKASAKRTGTKKAATRKSAAKRA